MHSRNKSANTSYSLATIEILVLIGVFFLTYWLSGIYTELGSIWQYGWICFTYTVLYVLCMLQSKMYNKTVFNYLDRMVKKLAFSVLISSTMIASIMYYGKIMLSRSFFFVFVALSFISLLIARCLHRSWISRNKNLHGERVAWVGDLDTIVKYCGYIDKTSIMTCKVGVISMEDRRSVRSQARMIAEGALNSHITDRRRGDSANGSTRFTWLGSIDRLESIIKEHNIDEIVFCLPASELDRIRGSARLCEQMGITFRVVLNVFEDFKVKSYICSVGTLPVLTFHTISLNNAQLFLKRVVDIVGAVIGIICTIPITIVTAALIKLDSKGSVFFSQSRIGRNGREFKMYKFRTMYQDAESRKSELHNRNKIKDGMIFKIDNDPRITRVGRIIRKLSIDEIPQFINVLIGNMSLVGIRPPTVDEVKRYGSAHWKRLCFRPGITGNWQVNGRSDVLDFNKVVELDSTYIDTWTLSLDFLIIIKTFKTIISRKGAA